MSNEIILLILLSIVLIAVIIKSNDETLVFVALFSLAISISYTLEAEYKKNTDERKAKIILNTEKRTYQIETYLKDLD